MFASRGVGAFQAAQAHQLLGPRLSMAGRRAVIWCPGVGNTERTFVDPLRAVSEPIAKQHPICSFAAAGTWGNDVSIARVEALRSWLAGAYGVDDASFFLVVVSHGAAIALNWARQHPELVEAVALVIPAVDVEDIRANNRGNNYQASIEAAYGDNATWQAQRATHNPMDYAGELTGLPIKAWYADDDPICLASRVDAFAAASGAERRSIGAVGHDAATVDGDEVLAFLDGHA